MVVSIAAYRDSVTEVWLCYCCQCKTMIQNDLNIAKAGYDREVYFRME
jgi:hypothetical protein